MYGQLAIRGPCGKAVPVGAVRDVGDGTVRVEFSARREGAHRVEATLGSKTGAGFVATVFIAPSVREYMSSQF